jgi:hypothetical protein
VAIDPSGTLLASASSDKYIRLFDWRSGELLDCLCGHADSITGLKFTADCRHLLSVSADGTIFVWDLHADTTQRLTDRLRQLYPVGTSAAMLGAAGGAGGAPSSPPDRLGMSMSLSRSIAPFKEAFPELDRELSDEEELLLLSVDDASSPIQHHSPDKNVSNHNSNPNSNHNQNPEHHINHNHSPDHKHNLNHTHSPLELSDASEDDLDALPVPLDPMDPMEAEMRAILDAHSTPPRPGRNQGEDGEAVSIARPSTLPKWAQTMKSAPRSQEEEEDDDLAYRVRSREKPPRASKWGQRIGQAGYTLFSELEEEGAVIKPDRRGDSSSDDEHEGDNGGPDVDAGEKQADEKRRKAFEDLESEYNMVQTQMREMGIVRDIATLDGPVPFGAEVVDEDDEPDAYSKVHPAPLVPAIPAKESALPVPAPSKLRAPSRSNSFTKPKPVQKPSKEVEPLEVAPVPAAPVNVASAPAQPAYEEMKGEMGVVEEDIVDENELMELKDDSDDSIMVEEAMRLPMLLTSPAALAAELNLRLPQDASFPPKSSSVPLTTEKLSHVTPPPVASGKSNHSAQTQSSTSPALSSLNSLIRPHEVVLDHLRRSVDGALGLFEYTLSGSPEAEILRRLYEGELESHVERIRQSLEKSREAQSSAQSGTQREEESME